MLKTIRGTRWRGELGGDYAVDPYRNCIIHKRIGPEDFGVYPGVLRDRQKLAT